MVEVGVATPENYAAFQKEILRILLYLIVILVAQGTEYSFNSLRTIATIMLLFNLTIQLSQLLGFEFPFRFLIEYYLGETGSIRHLNLARADLSSGFRSGSVYINPNVYVPYPMMFLAISLQAVDLSKKAIPKIHFSVLAFLCFISILLTGSRTGFVGALIILGVYIINNKRMSNISKLVFLVFAFFVVLYIVTRVDARFTDIQGGLEDSYAFKIRGLFYYINHVDPISFIIGNNTNIGSSLWHFDFEWGYAFVYYGFVGIALYASLYKLLLRKITFESRNGESSLRLMYVGVITAFFVESLTATVFFNANIFYFVAAIFFVKRISV